MSDTFVHESAYVDDGVTLGKGTKIWHFCHVLPGTVIGENCSLGQNVMAGPDVRIGDGCKIQNNVALYKGVVLEDGIFYLAPEIGHEDNHVVIHSRSVADRVREQGFQLRRVVSSLDSVKIEAALCFKAPFVFFRSLVNLAMVILTGRERVQPCFHAGFSPIASSRSDMCSAIA
ncbi:DapH/DapD/GlmU-related protein [uncultured Algimonas sp.]|uniref:DapH/DapD/GlmU-related protein n=1 Tax=uncultured Algimonas sp. TaxID=1547920 RepID=UPI0026261E22|nr:DapH/DapD/GlmU-related protein [uncultured Algimonas sp.]